MLPPLPLRRFHLKSLLQNSGVQVIPLLARKPRRLLTYQDAVKVSAKVCKDPGLPVQEGCSFGAKAALADYERLRRYCDGHWSYVGVIVTASRDGIELGHASLWGLESDAGDYLTDTANELADEALDEAKVTLTRIAA